MLLLHVWLDMHLWVLLHHYSPMQEASALSVLHGDLWVTTTIEKVDGISIGLRTIHHEAFEVGLLHAIFSY